MLKYLRIAVTALSLTACVLLIALWVRSYGRIEKLLLVYQSPKAIRLMWSDGQVQVEHASDRPVLITSSALGTINWREPTFASAFTSGANLYSLDFALNHFDAENSVPFSIPVAIAATLAVVPWIRYRFSLRTLLIATTLVAVVLGIIVAAR